MPQKNLYRRYKINLKTTSGGPDDFAMMSEMISRRLKSAISLPELMIIDGGKGQLSVVLKQISQIGRISPIHVVGLAKRLETIITKDGTQINLPEDSPALHLIQRLRDEAHRFSKKYHIFLRSKNMLTLLGNVP